MSSGDHNCLLSWLWGKGSSQAIFNLSSDEVDSNQFIKAICRGEGTGWDPLPARISPRPSPHHRLSFAHFSVSPREFVEAKGMQDIVGCLLVDAEERDLSKAKFTLPLQMDQLLYQQLYKRDNFDQMVRRLLQNRGNGKHFWLVFLAKGKSANVGSSEAMKYVFRNETGGRTKDEMVLFHRPFCNPKKKKKRFYKRKLDPPVKDALGKKKSLRNCFPSPSTTPTTTWSLPQLCPYLENIFTKKWYNRLQEHLLALDQSVYANTVSLHMHAPIFTGKVAAEEAMRKEVGWEYPERPKSIPEKSKVKNTTEAWDRWKGEYEKALKERDNEDKDSKGKSSVDDRIQKGKNVVRRQMTKKYFETYLKKHREPIPFPDFSRLRDSLPS